MHERFCRCRRGALGRIPKPVSISSLPRAEAMIPEPEGRGPPISLDLAEIEALRLVELEGYPYCEAAISMGISRNTVWRLVESGKVKMITAILEGRRLEISHQ